MQTNYKYWQILIYIILIISTIIAPTFMIMNKDSNYSLVIRPIIWVCLFLICLILMRDKYARVGRKKEILKSVLLVTISYIILYYMIGVIIGYQYSPLSHTIVGIARNIWSMTLVVVMQEYVRATLLGNGSKKVIKYIFVTTLFILISFNWKECIESCTTLASTFEYAVSSILPLVTTNAVCTYLAVKLGAIPNILYRAPISIALVLTPVVPDLNWFFVGSFQIILDYVLFIVMKFELDKEENLSRKIRMPKNRESNPIHNIPFLIVIVVFILFVAGIFKYMPVAVMSNSMYPVFSRGDVVVIKKLNEQQKLDLKEGDIVEYVLDGKIILHRIYAIADQEKGIYITKGDNNRKCRL